MEVLQPRRVASDDHPCRVVEFVPKKDPMIQTLLRTRRDIYPDHTQAAFEDALTRHFRITEVASLPKSERTLYAIARR